MTLSDAKKLSPGAKLRVVRESVSILDGTLHPVIRNNNIVTFVAVSGDKIRIKEATSTSTGWFPDRFVLHKPYTNGSLNDGGNL